MFYKVICWYGVMTIFDPFIVLLIDFICTDFENGDYFKFYNYFFKKQNNGLVGIYLTLFLIFGLVTLNALIFYQYMIFVHMNGRILDLYKRLSGSMKSFFIPHDNEISLKYVQWVVERAKRKNFILRSARQNVTDKKGKEKQIQFIYLYKYQENNQICRCRLFVKDQDGSICEVPQSKLLLREDELLSLTQDLQTGRASGFGDNFSKVVQMLNMKESQKFDKSGRLGNTLIIGSLAVSPSKSMSMKREDATPMEFFTQEREEGGGDFDIKSPFKVAGNA
jgi:ferredoxin-thioredoxin reductase catalytic subunit